MAIRMKQHAPDFDRGKTVWVGPRTEEQKPKLCSRCGMPVTLAYRVYKREFDRKKNDLAVVKGQYEVAHIVDNSPVFDMCPYPSLLDRLNARIEAERNEEETVKGPGDKRTIHYEVVSPGSQAVKVGCGAKGSLWTTLDSESVTCYNCKARLGKETKPPIDFNTVDVQDLRDQILSQSQSQGQSQNQKEQSKGMSAETNQTTAAPGGKKMTAADIKNKIAASQAKKQGAAATLVQEENEAPLPKETKTVKKQQVQAAKAEKTPKLLNACGCGCGQPCKAKFLPGHDAKLHGWVKKLSNGKMSLVDLPAQVRNGMYAKVKQSAVKDGDGNVVLGGVEPTVDEASYLETLQGLGGPAA